MDETFKMPNWHLEYGRGENVKYLLFAFTELGVAMLSSVLKSQMAIEINRRIMRVSCRCAVALRMRRSTRPSLPRCNFVVFRYVFISARWLSGLKPAAMPLCTPSSMALLRASIRLSSSFRSRSSARIASLVILECFGENVIRY